jgi:hypothetical protein
MTDTAIKIPLEPVVSSNLAAYGYDGPKQILAVEFKGGDIFHYAGVPLEVALAFLQAESKGSFYAQQIRGKYQGQKMTGHCPACGALGWVGDRCEDCGTAEVAADPYTPKEHKHDESAAAGRA